MRKSSVFPYVVILVLLIGFYYYRQTVPKSESETPVPTETEAPSGRERDSMELDAVESVRFGKIISERFPSGYKQIFYPSTVSVCFKESQYQTVKALSNTRNQFGDGLRIEHTVVTKSGLSWSHETWVPPVSKGKCFECLLYETRQANVPKDELVDGNIVSYRYRIYFKKDGTYVDYFSGVVSDF